MSGEVNDFPVRWAFNEQQDEAGNKLVGIVISGQFMSFMVAMPLDVAEQLNEKFHGALAAAIEQIRSPKSLVVPGFKTIQDLQKGKK